MCRPFTQAHAALVLWCGAGGLRTPQQPQFGAAVGSDMAARGIGSTVHSLGLTVSVSFFSGQAKGLALGLDFLVCCCWVFIPCRQSVGGACVGMCQLLVAKGTVCWQLKE